MSNLEDKLEVGPELEVDIQDPLPLQEGKVDSLRHRGMTAAAAAPGIEDTLKTVVVEAEPVVRVRSRFEFQVGHRTTLTTDQNYTFIFFSTSYQNCKQSLKKLDTFLENKVL